MQTVQAVYSDGVFRPMAPVTLPENSCVEFEPRVVADARTMPTLDDLYALLDVRFESGQRDIAERHNEHQP